MHKHKEISFQRSPFYFLSPCIWNFCFDENTIERISKLIWELFSNYISFGNSWRKETTIFYKEFHFGELDEKLLLYLLSVPDQTRMQYYVYSNWISILQQYLEYSWFFSLLTTLFSFSLPCHPSIHCSSYCIDERLDSTANHMHKLKSCNIYRFSIIKSIGLFIFSKDSFGVFYVMERRLRMIGESILYWHKEFTGFAVY